MKEFYVSLRSVGDVRDFVDLASVQPFDVTVGNDHQNINGKDLMGMFSLDYERPLQVRMHCSEEEYLQFKQEAQSFLH